MYMDFLFYLKTLSKGEKTEHILFISVVLGILLLIGIGLEIFEKKYTKQYEIIKSFLNKFNMFSKKQTKKDV